eukprot:CAMPEP_0117527016 /NCGR_PEP_ID=MMETSP0784-20121206/36582_1 /TAXON_ID=39447 /ORGANISM="" /LENGTH=588 /DNA_ID=CAMNT_0005323259 /DNA_START=19 /DNA_END=1786 /DNA_ORIENTATION=-
MSEGRIAANLLCLLVFWIFIWLSVQAFALALLPHIRLQAGNIEINAMDLHHSHFLKSFSVLAISIVFFALGLEESVHHFIIGVKKAWGIASIGALVPFLVGFICTTLFWPDAGTEVALMGGLAVTATAVSLTMIALKAEGLASTNAAVGIMTSAVLDDIASLAMVAICVPIATGEGEVTFFGIVLIMFKAVGFFAVVAFAHVAVLPDNIQSGPFKGIPILSRFGVKSLLEWNEGKLSTLVALAYGMFWCMVAILFGFHPAIGAYMAGLIMEESYFETKNGDNKFHEVFHHIETVAYSWMGPFFFLELGSTIAVEGEMLAGVAGYTIAFFILLFIGQFASATLAAKYVPGGYEWYEAVMIGFGMMGRAELFFVVLELCYVQHHIMSREIMTTFALTAMLMNISVPVSITLYKPFYNKYAAAHAGVLEDAADGQPPADEAKELEAAEAPTEASTTRENTGVGQDEAHVGQKTPEDHETVLPTDTKEVTASYAAVDNEPVKETYLVYGDPRLKDLDSIDLGVQPAMTPRDSEVGSEFWDKGAEQKEQTDGEKHRPHRSMPKVGAILPMVCGCMRVDDAKNPIVTEHSRRAP